MTALNPPDMQPASLTSHRIVNWIAGRLLTALHGTKERHDVLRCPTFVAHGGPPVIVRHTPSHIIRTVDATSASDYATPHPMLGLQVAGGIRLGAIPPIKPRKINVS